MTRALGLSDQRCSSVMQGPPGDSVPVRGLDGQRDTHGLGVLGEPGRAAVIDYFGAEFVVAWFVALDRVQPAERRCGRP
jgi:hypothetical protein